MEFNQKMFKVKDVVQVREESRFQIILFTFIFIQFPSLKNIPVST